MSEHINKSSKIKFYETIKIGLIVSALIGAILPWIIFPILNYKGSNSVVTLTSIAGIIRFLAGSKNQMVINIALHNFVIAIFCFILSFLTRGILGCIFIFFNFFIIGMVLYEIPTFNTFLFLFLEALGLYIAAFYGIFLSEKRVKKNLSLRNICKSSIILMIIIAAIYYLASIIESGLILDKWK